MAKQFKVLLPRSFHTLVSTASLDHRSISIADRRFTVLMIY
jgi:hypothetical protein